MFIFRLRKLRKSPTVPIGQTHPHHILPKRKQSKTKIKRCGSKNLKPVCHVRFSDKKWTIHALNIPPRGLNLQIRLGG